MGDLLRAAWRWHVTLARAGRRSSVSQDGSEIADRVDVLPDCPAFRANLSMHLRGVLGAPSPLVGEGGFAEGKRGGGFYPALAKPREPPPRGQAWRCRPPLPQRERVARSLGKTISTHPAPTCLWCR